LRASPVRTCFAAMRESGLKGYFKLLSLRADKILPSWGGHSAACLRRNGCKTFGAFQISDSIYRESFAGRSWNGSCRIGLGRVNDPILRDRIPRALVRDSPPVERRNRCTHRG